MSFVPPVLPCYRHRSHIVLSHWELWSSTLYHIVLKLRGCDTFQTRGGGHYRTVVCSLEFSGSPVLRLCVTVLSQSPWEGKQVASRLFLSKKLCKRNLKKHMKKVHRGMISINWCLRNMKNIFVGQMFELAIGKLYMARTVLANLMFYATHLVDEKHKQYWGADTRKFEAALCFL